MFAAKPEQGASSQIEFKTSSLREGAADEAIQDNFFWIGTLLRGSR
ncbi:MAG: hypothetical protein MUD06_06065 [Rhodospirillales bacterium]|jgi:hypothetical protein|nr:hypothetical protein [Rhodospirillales bacterium]